MHIVKLLQIWLMESEAGLMILIDCFFFHLNSSLLQPPFFICGVIRNLKH